MPLGCSLCNAFSWVDDAQNRGRVGWVGQDQLCPFNGVCTDLGFITPIVREAMQSCDYMILESNHEPDMVHASRRPASLKARIMGRTGHLSNEQAGTFLQELSHANLAHLSGECNCPERALQVVNNITGGTIPLAIAHQHQVGTPINC